MPVFFLCTHISLSTSHYRLEALYPRLKSLGGGRGGKAGAAAAAATSVPHCHIAEPWLSHIVSGTKTHEGRVHRGLWARLVRGDLVIASNDRYTEVELEVTGLRKFADFDEAYDALQTALLPEGATNPAEALAIYRQWNSAESVLEAGGVVAVGVVVRRVVRAEPSRYMVAAMYVDKQTNKQTTLYIWPHHQLRLHFTAR